MAEDDDPRALERGGAVDGDTPAQSDRDVLFGEAELHARDATTYSRHLLSC
jgi:hypothetical protein